MKICVAYGLGFIRTRDLIAMAEHVRETGETPYLPPLQEDAREIEPYEFSLDETVKGALQHLPFGRKGRAKAVPLKKPVGGFMRVPR